MRRSALLVGCLIAAGCAGGSPSEPRPEPRGDKLLDVWAGLEAGDAQSAGRAPDVCGEPFGTWFTDFGARGLACAAAQVAAPADVVARAGVRPFQSGPHLATAEAVAFDLDAPRDFGRYNPAFVRWVLRHGVPGEDTAALKVAGPIYERRLSRLARVYWLALRDLEGAGFPERTPPGPLADYAAFLAGGPVPVGAEGLDADGRPSGGFSVFAFSERSRALIPALGMAQENEWPVTYEANTAYGFWLRRRADGTHALWRDGLRTLLARYDEDWLSRNAG